MPWKTRDLECLLNLKGEAEYKYHTPADIDLITAFKAARPDVKVVYSRGRGSWLLTV